MATELVPVSQQNNLIWLIGNLSIPKHVHANHTWLPDSACILLCFGSLQLYSLMVLCIVGYEPEAEALSPYTSNPSTSITYCTRKYSR